MFDDIRPYLDSEIPAAMQRMAADPVFPVVCRYLFPERPVEEVAAELRACRSAWDFQHVFMYHAVYSVARQTTTSFTTSGLDALDPAKNYLFVSNHRDIVMDAAFLQVLLLDAGLRTSEITFGANLMQGDFVVDFGRSNKMFRVERPTTVASSREFLLKSQRLSEYIRYAILEKGESVWIAQRNGRTKDGHDATDPGIVKMFGMAGSIEDLNIVPLSISYEWEPCDVLKAAELTALAATGHYEKKPGEDLHSILTGILQPKGGVHITAGKPLVHEDFVPLQGLQRNAFNRALAALIDERIHAGYRLWPSNLVAADILEGTENGGYTPKEKAAFEAHIAAAPEALRPLLLKIYAGPALAVRPKR
jgi:hypothetical protein